MQLKIALVGNPNSGKTTLFNVLTGSTAQVGNWPGVTVEKKVGYLKTNKDIQIIDLPGTYSLSPFTTEERITRDYIVNENPDIIINIVDSTNLDRNLYLTTQVLETDIKTIVALNMMDVIKKRDVHINKEKLSEALKCPIVEISATKEQGIDELINEVLNYHKQVKKEILNIYTEELNTTLRKICNLLDLKEDSLYYSVKVFEKDEIIIDDLVIDDSTKNEIFKLVDIYEQEQNDTSSSIISSYRYQFIDELIDKVIDKKGTSSKITEIIDKVVVSKIIGIPIFLFVMWLVYFISVQWLGDITIGFMEELFENIGEAASNFLSNIQVMDWLHDLIVDGIIGGVGSVLVFVPQLALLFLLLTFLEDCGYMSRIAFVMDRVFKKLGMSGKSFIPLVIGTGCSVPAIMSTRTIENEKERRLTIMLTPFIPCSAKMPVFTLFITVFFFNNSLMAPALYAIGIIIVIISGLILKRTKLFKKDESTFILELPDYRFPTIKNLFLHTYEKIKSFIIKAGTIIFVACIVIWFLQSFDWSLVRVDTEQSILRSIGEFIAPIFIPLGWGNWESTVAIISGFLAKETIVATFGIILGEEFLTISLTNLFTTASALSFVIFILLASPCFAAIGATRREMGSWKWTFITLIYQTGLAYLVSLMVYQVGNVIL